MSSQPAEGARVRVTIGQLEVGLDRAANLAAAEDVLRTAAAAGARLAVLPEYASQYDSRGVGLEHAELLDGPWVTGLRDAAARHGVAVVAGVTVPVDAHLAGGAVADGAEARGAVDAHGGPDAVVGEAEACNVLVAIGADGALLGTYTKVHMYDAFGFRESDSLRAGDPAAKPFVFDVEGLTVGAVTCYDLRFPESMRRVAVAGAQIVLVPAAWVAGPGKAEQWRALLVARAIENTAFVAGVGQAGAGRTGRSLVVDPNGEVLTELGDEPRTVTVDLDLGLIARVRERNPVLELRRYDVVPRV